MKINKMKIGKYGCIQEKEINFGDGVSVIRGNNESGKSTTHQAMLALMFGFKNTGTKNKFALTPKAKSFKGGYPIIEGQCSDRLGDYGVLRYFEGNAPNRSVSKNGIITKTDNIPLDVFKGISRDTYEGIYSLDIDQIVKLKESWDKEQDSILAGLLPDFLLPNEKIMENLDKRIKDAWKGKTATKLSKAKEIDESIIELKSKMHQAKKDQADLRLLEIEQEETQEKIEQCSMEIEDLSKKEIGFKRQRDFYNEYYEINDILIENSQIESYKDVPMDTRHYLKRLAEAVESGKVKSEEINKKIIKLKDTINQYISQSKSIDYNKEVVPKAEAIVNNLSALKTRSLRDVDKEKEKRNKITARTKRMFTNKFTWDSFKDVMKINIADCLAVWDNIVRVNGEKAQTSQKVLENRSTKEILPFKNLGKVDYLLLASAFVGVLMIFIPLGISRIITIILGALILAGSAAAFYFKRPKNGQSEENEYTIVLKRLNDEYVRLTNDLKKKLAFSFIPVEKHNHLDDSLIESIAQLQDDYLEYTKIKEDVAKDEEEIKKNENEVTKIAMDVLGKSFDYKTDTLQMRDKLNEMLKLESNAKAAQGEIGALDEQLLEIKNSIFVDEKQIQDINNRLYTVEGKNIMEKADKLMRMRKDYASAQSRQHVQKQKYTDYDELINKIDKGIEAKIFDIETELAKVIELLDNNREKRQEYNAKKGEISQEIKYLKENGLVPAIIDGQLKDKREERESRIRLRDEYAICYGIIQKARDKFVSEYSPEFLDKASNYLSLITDGRYNQIRLNDKGTSIMVMQGTSRIFDFDKIDNTISRGTKEQIYFALRLAMLNRFDPDGEKLPIVLDEALVNWDIKRFAKLMKIINDVAKERQVFMFTCHDYVVDIVSSANDNFKLIDI